MSAAAHTLGERGGEQAHTLSIAELPAAHARPQASSANGNAILPTGTLLGGAVRPSSTALRTNLAALCPSTIANVGGSQAHLNMQPFLTLSFCIALQGIFPSQT